MIRVMTLPRSATLRLPSRGGRRSSEPRGGKSMESTPVRPTTVPLPHRHRPPLSEAVIRSLVTEIVIGTYPPGTPLPSAGMLGEQYQVSRTVIREATTSLTEKGLVATRQGWGTVVLDQDQWSLLDPMVLDALFQREDRLVYLDNLIEIRSLLE